MRFRLAAAITGLNAAGLLVTAAAWTWRLAVEGTDSLAFTVGLIVLVAAFGAVLAWIAVGLAGSNGRFVGAALAWQLIMAGVSVAWLQTGVSPWGIALLVTSLAGCAVLIWTRAQVAGGSGSGGDETPR